MEQTEISIVVPVYKNEQTIVPLYELLVTYLSEMDVSYEIIYVNDASPDSSWDIIEELCQRDKKVKGVKLSRNFGQHPAIFCGLGYSKGNVVIVMDCDLQEDPKYIPELYNQYKKGYDIVFTHRKKRKHSFWKNFTAKIYTSIYNFLIDNKNLANSENVGTYSLISRKVVSNFLSFKDCQFHYLIILRWMGFKTSYIEIEHYERKSGKSAYNFSKLVEHALVAIVFQSDKLLRLNIYLGLFISIFAFVAGLIIIIAYFIQGFAHGWTSIITLILFSLGVILFSIGVLGLYIGKMFEQTKQRPIFVVDEILNLR